MAESYGFFDAEELVSGEFDREYIAEQFANYFKLFIGNGVFASPTNQLKVLAGTGMKIIIKQGWAYLNGYWYHNDADLELTVPPNITSATVNSGVFIQFDSSERTIGAVIATGRTEVDREAPKYELKIAELSIATGTTAVTDSMITDTRTDEEVCGFVVGLVDVIETADLFQQFRATFTEWLAAQDSQFSAWYTENTAAFDTWFDHMKDQLDSDAAGHLQLEIDDQSEYIRQVDAGLPPVGTLTFNNDGSITNTFSVNEKIDTVFNNDGSISAIYTKNGSSIERKTVFNSDGSISVIEVVPE